MTTDSRPFLQDEARNNMSPPEWTLVSELGIEYAPNSELCVESPLIHPVAAEKGNDGTYLIVDETYLGKYSKLSTECRTIHVNREGRILYDSCAAGLPDGYGCFINDGNIALLGRARTEILVVSQSGSIRRQIELCRHTKGMPRLVAWTWRGTFLVQSVLRVNESDIIEISPDGDLLWSLPQGSRRDLGFPGSISLTALNNVLVADEYHHVLVEIQRDGNIVWRYGVRDVPAGKSGHLANPKSVQESLSGRRLVADTRNHRVLCLEAGGLDREILPKEGTFWSPTFARELHGGNVLICDAGNRRVVEIRPDATTEWQYGPPIALKRWFSYPRSVEKIDGGYTIADTGNDRVVEVVGSTVRPISRKNEKVFFWPRCARQLPGGGYLVADARNVRVLEISRSGEIVRTLAAQAMPNDLMLRDPHDVRAVGQDQLLIVDSASNLVLFCDWSGRVSRMIGGNDGIRLSDPHSAQLLKNGDLLVTDTGNDRVLRIDESGAIVAQFETLPAGNRYLRLAKPRYAEVSLDNTLVIADSDNNRILAANTEGEFRWELNEIPGSPIRTLLQPRWVQAISSNEILVSDHHHHRIVHLRRRSE